MRYGVSTNISQSRLTIVVARSKCEVLDVSPGLVMTSYAAELVVDQARWSMEVAPFTPTPRCLLDASCGVYMHQLSHGVRLDVV